ncbi:MAG: dockerin type I domain-containing protein [Gemmatimonadaceae bacterium]
MIGRALALGCALAGIASLTRAQLLETRTVEGVLHVVWGDPESPGADAQGGPRYWAFLTTDSGESIDVEPAFGADLTPGELVALNGRRVRVTGAAGSLRRWPGLAAGPALTIRAHAIEGAGAAHSLIALGAAPAAPAWPVQQRPYAILLCKFADIPDEPLPYSAYEAMYGNAFGGADAFYREVSEGRITIAGTKVYGWYTLPQPRSAYIVNDRANLTALFNDCTRRGDADVDYRQVVGMAMHFNATLDCCSWGGSRTATLDSVTKTFATMWNASWARSGTSWHEMGHSVGLPHSGGPYGRTYDSVWDVMSSSTSGRYLTREFGFGGAHFIAYHKNLLGLIPAGRRVTVTSGVWRGVLEPHARLAGAGPAGPVLVTVPLADPGRFGQGYTVELRAKTGYDLRLPRAAVLIHSIVPGRAEPAQLVDADGDGDPNDGGVTWTVGEVFADPAAGIVVTIDSLTASGVAVTVRNAGSGPVLAASGRTTARQYAEATTPLDSVHVSGVAAWRAANRRSWLSLVRSSGAAGEHLVYRSDTRSLAPGRYADTVRVYAASGTTVPATYVVEVVIAPASEVVALSLAGRRDSARTGVTSPVDSVLLALNGRLANAAWTATRSSPRLFIGMRAANGSLIVDLTTTQLTGAGTRWLHYRRGPESAAGTTVDTLTVTVADAAPIVLRMVDTLEAFNHVTIRLSRSGGQRRVRQGDLGTLDSLGVTFDDPRNATLDWFATNRRTTVNRLRNTRGSGGHTLRWLVDGSQLAGTGSALDSIFVCSSLSAVCAMYVDTLTYEATANDLRLSRAGGRAAVPRGTRQRSDSLFVLSLGPAGRSRLWTASAGSPRISFHARDAFTANGAGVGSALLSWSRNSNDLAPGTYVDTILVHADGVPESPLRYIDTLVVHPAPDMIGDVDRDGSITSGDAVIVLRSLVGLSIPPGADATAGDANCDGRVTSADAQLILQLDVGIPPQGSCLGRARLTTAQSR